MSKFKKEMLTSLLLIILSALLSHKLINVMTLNKVNQDNL
jgi:hypothetical protein